MTEYFTAHDVLKKVEGLNSLSTLNKWANFIQKECDYQFHYDYVRLTSHTRTKRTINHRKTRMFSMEEIQKFQKVVELIPTLGRDTSLREQFDNQHRLETMKHSELVDEVFKQIYAELRNKNDLLETLAQKVQHLEKQYQTLKQRFIQLEETLSTQEQASSGWFRRKW
ncbi:hypothetical protein P7G42_08855 [Enterococcus faecalis]|uniref:hypothetical protein n=1 Tax=Enterococcus faecalis TaxID=1351 RepID=UPI002241943E|nr:hypothetical protein [Enterococcus faecalis]MDT2052336.1 hypothetical protein [Enterococcus faecalis]WDA18249.1 hypothetical protein PSC77_13065 [Enterococcus faecalis]